MKKKNHNTPHIVLKELIDIPYFQKLTDSFSRLTGITIAILDITGEILVASGWKKICTEFHRKNPTTAARCRESDTVLAGQLAKGKKYNIYKCKNGLVDVAVPIIVENMHIGNLFTGQFFFEPPDIDYFIKQAEEFQFDKNTYLELLQNVPILSKEKIEQAMEFLSDLTVIIGNSALDKKKLLESNIRLEQKVRERTADLVESNEKFRSLSEAAFEGIVITNESIIIEANDAICNMVGYQSSEFIGESVLNYVHPEERKHVKSKILSGYDQPYETRCVRKDGSSFPIEVHAKMFSYKGQQVRVTAIRDISERIKAEENKKKERLRLYALLDTLPAFLYLQAADYSIKFANKYYRERFGETENVPCFKSLWGRDEPCEVCPTFKVFDTQEPQVWLWDAAPDGRTYQVYDYPFIDTDEKLYVLELGIDITEQKHIEREREELITKLEKALAEIKTLQGILPICSICKNIRNDEGYYEQIEAYIHKHTGVDFSHTICHPCMEKHYPEEYK